MTQLVHVRGSRSEGLRGLTIVVATATFLVACSSGDADNNETIHPSPDASVTSHSTSTSASRPERAATRYMAMLMAGDYDGAAMWVIPSQQGILQALSLGSGADTPPGFSGQLDVGSVEATGEDTATVTFVGTMCRDIPADDCVVNRDPQSTDPTFLVHLIDTGDAGWKIVFQAPEVDK